MDKIKRTNGQPMIYKRLQENKRLSNMNPTNTVALVTGVIPLKNSPLPSMLNKTFLSFHTGFILSLI
jgi:hypothetical protein